MKCSYLYTIQPQDVDNQRHVRLYTLENYLLNAAGKASEEQGCGLTVLHPMGYTWILTRLTLELDYLPTMYDTVRIETWVEQNAHMLSIRDFRLYVVDKQNDRERAIGQGQSVWAVMDEHKRSIVNVFDHPMFADTEDGEKLDITRAKRHVPFATTDGEKTTTVNYSDCDYNNHCNSCKYVEKMLDTYIPTYQLPIRLDVNYIKETYLGDCIHTACHKDGDSIYYQQRDAQQHLLCTAHLTLHTT